MLSQILLKDTPISLVSQHPYQVLAIRWLRTKQWLPSHDAIRLNNFVSNNRSNEVYRVTPARMSGLLLDSSYPRLH